MGDVFIEPLDLAQAVFWVVVMPVVFWVLLLALLTLKD